MKALVVIILLFISSYSIAQTSQKKCPDLFENLEKKCMEGTKQACIDGAKCIQDKDPLKAQRLNKESCIKFRDQFACTLYATQLFNTDEIEALKTLALSCKGGFAYACQVAKSLQSKHESKEALEEKTPLEYKNGIKEMENKKPQEAKKHFAASCELNFLLACKQLLRISLQEKNDNDSEKYLSKLCKANDAESCRDFGMRLLRKKDYSNALPYLKNSCDSGVIRSCGSLGLAQYRLGNIILALKNFKAACDANIQEFCKVVKDYEVDLKKACLVKESLETCRHYLNY
jgi:hypothetical protein